MKIQIDTSSGNARITTTDPHCIEWETIQRFIKDMLPISEISNEVFEIEWHVFLACRGEFVRLCRIYDVPIDISEEVKTQLSAAASISYNKVKNNPPIDEDELISKLLEVGFRRALTNEQKRNVRKMAALPASATFSVPGAGKTTEALAYFFYSAQENDKLLIVAPKNAFPAWDEQLSACIGSDESVVRLTGGYSNIKNILKAKPRFSIIAYRQFSLVTELLIDYLRKNPVFMFLDESHRIKGGSGKVIVDSILQTSYLPKKKLILSGTPMPQADVDLDPQLSFLYPELNMRNNSSINLIQPIYVRTTKDELGLDPPKRKVISVSLTGEQQAFYLLLRSETARQMQGISRFNRANLRKMGRSIIKLMQFVSNPALLAQDVAGTFSEELSRVLVGGKSIKVDYACERARQLARKGEKSIIWTSYVNNVELIANRLEDIGADYIHGGVDAGDDREAYTREWKIKRFHDDENAMVLVANPAAAAEGISLHQVCHTAIYVDRSFNAAHYLQSEDRIHRLGLAPGISTNIEIIECRDTIDEVVSERLKNKVARMAEVLNDKSLNINEDDYAYEEENDVLSIVGLEEGDAVAILDYLRGCDDD